jgi:hypothetical protein
MLLLAAVAMIVSLDASAQWITNGTNINNTNSGNVGIGTASPAGKLHIGGSTFPTLLLDHPTETRFLIRVDGVNVFTFNHDGTSGQLGTTNGGGMMSINSGSARRLNILSNGRVGIGTTTPSEVLHVVGNALFNGTVSGTNIQAQYQDLAEWVPATEDLAPGTVVVLNITKNNEVMASNTSYDTLVAGVVSAQPGLILGAGGEGKEQIATTGRVKVRVDATNGPIRVGDLLVTSDKPGMAMRSEPMAIQGRKFHQPGTIIGKALEPLEKGQGEILILLSLQ